MPPLPSSTAYSCKDDRAAGQPFGLDWHLWIPCVTGTRSRSSPPLALSLLPSRHFNGDASSLRLAFTWNVTATPDTIPSLARKRRHASTKHLPAGPNISSRNCPVQQTSSLPRTRQTQHVDVCATCSSPCRPSLRARTRWIVRGTPSRHGITAWPRPTASGQLLLASSSAASSSYPS